MARQPTKENEQAAEVVQVRNVTGGPIFADPVRGEAAVKRAVGEIFTMPAKAADVLVRRGQVVVIE